MWHLLISHAAFCVGCISALHLSFCQEKQENEKGQLAVSALLLRFYHKKQENHAAISNRFSVDAANNAFKALTNFIPFIVI